LIQYFSNKNGSEASGRRENTYGNIEREKYFTGEETAVG
jgi:hypothetical protein